MPEPVEPVRPLDAIRNAFDGRAATYDEDVMHRAVAAEVASFAALDEVTTALDVATGTGLVLRALRARSPQLRLIGADISAGMLDVAARELQTAEWVEADAAGLPLPDASVDLITCVTALHIIPDTAGTVAEWHRVLRPGGRVVTATFLTGPAHDASRARFRHEPTSERPYVRDHIPFRTLESFTATFADLGFAPGRHQTWSNDVDKVLIAELSQLPAG